MNASARAGFTVLEAAIALAIIAASAIGVLGAFGAHTRGVSQMRDQAELAALAQDVLARIRVLRTAEFTPLPDSLAKGDFGPPFVGATWRATVVPVSSEPQLLEILVTTSRATASYELRTRRFVPDLQPDAR